MAEFHRAPTAEMLPATARRLLASMIATATAPILQTYPPAEQLSWDAKENEAAEFAAVAAAAAIDESVPAPLPKDYPMLRCEIAAELAIAAGDVTPSQLADKVESVLWMASRWRALISALAGIRKRYLFAIDSTATTDELRILIFTAQAEIAALGGE